MSRKGGRAWRKRVYGISMLDQQNYKLVFGVFWMFLGDYTKVLLRITDMKKSETDSNPIATV